MAPLPDPPQNIDSKLDGETRPMPIGPVITSSDEEEVSNNEYHLLPQEDEHTDLTCLLNALSTHGVNTIPDEEPTSCEEGDEREISHPPSLNVECQLTKDIDEANKAHNVESIKERELLWSNNKTDIVLTPEKETVIKNAMAGFTLPATNVPQWAFDVSEEAWKSKVSAITHN